MKYIRAYQIIEKENNVGQGLGSMHPSCLLDVEMLYANERELAGAEFKQTAGWPMTKSVNQTSM